MKGATVAIAVVVIAAMAVALTRGGDRPDKFGEAVGCYAAANEQLSVGSDGQLRFGETSVTVSAYQDKVGFGLSPARGVYIDSFHGDRLTTAASPLKLRMSGDRRQLFIPDFRNRRDAMSFARIPC